MNKQTRNPLASFSAAPAIFAAALILVSSIAAAQPSMNPEDEEAQLHFEIGQRALSDGRYDEALREFERSFELSDRPALLFNIGIANQRLRNDEAALAAYRAFIERVPTAQANTNVEQRIAVLEGTIENTEPDELDDPDLSAETAAQTLDNASPRSDTPAPEGEEGSVLTTWWFWALVGVVVVGAGVGIAIAATSETEEPLPSGFGPVTQTLSF